jgi:hypothetical protein
MRKKAKKTLRRKIKRLKRRLKEAHKK